ncbi:tail fiber domain-containing protein [Duffyella gerundensis]|uniref:tail fiber domain-containing protein n=1 Tax=Duffyella gerundensis TaxID=1619313 RepID=UPI001654342D|nr:tail fiber domain-containing protein [Duffyella gerundensis]
MPAGTIALTNNSAAVTGTGTSFASELKANDFVVVVVGGVTYTLGVKSVESATALTLIAAYGGATTSGLSWTSVPNATLVGITAQVAADVAKAIRGLNLDKANWQQVFTGTGNVTVNLPDGTSFTGPAWNGIASSISGKMNKSQNLNDVANKATARSNLGLGDAATMGVGTTANTVAAGNDSRLDGALPKSGGNLTGNVLSSAQYISTYKGSSFYCHPNAFDGTYNMHADSRNGDGTVVLQNGLFLQTGQYWAERDILTQGGAAYVWEKRNDGSFRSPGTIYASGNALTSDRRLKSNFEPVDYDIDIIDKIIPQRYDKRSPEGDVPVPPAESEPLEPVEGEEREEPISSGPVPVTPTVSRELGIVAQDLQAVLPDLVSEYYWNEKYPDLLSINYSGLAAWLVGYVANLKDMVKAQGDTISKQDGIISNMESRLAELEARMKAIDGLDA